MGAGDIPELTNLIRVDRLNEQTGQKRHLLLTTSWDEDIEKCTLTTQYRAGGSSSDVGQFQIEVISTRRSAQGERALRTAGMTKQKRIGILVYQRIEEFDGEKRGEGGMWRGSPEVEGWAALVMSVRTHS